MRTQTKCTFALLGMFIVEILPIPFSAIFSLYVVRKRPLWLPGLVDRLYADKLVDENALLQPDFSGHDPMVTRKKCTITLASMLTVDIIVPFTIPFGLLIVRKRPLWFKNVVARLYADQLEGNILIQDDVEDIDGETIELMEKKLLELECSNVDYVQSLGKKERSL